MGRFILLNYITRWGQNMNSGLHLRPAEIIIIIIYYPPDVLKYKILKNNLKTE